MTKLFSLKFEAVKGCEFLALKCSVTNILWCMNAKKNEKLRMKINELILKKNCAWLAIKKYLLAEPII